MKTLRGISELAEPLKSSIVTIGNFDGVHIGHVEILSRVIESAKATNSHSVVLTFSPHPREVLTPEKPFSRIFDQSDQVHEIEALGVDYLVFEPFSRDLSQVSAERFLRDWVLKPFSLKKLIVGYDFSFGAHREGTLEYLNTASLNLGFDIEIVEPYKQNDEVVSSTRIRKYLTSGQVESAGKLLGRPFYLRGVVIKGEGRGTGIGIPTANLRTPATLLPKPGVYATRTLVGGKSYNSVTNVGRNPTFSPSGDQPNKVETNIFDFDEEIYGREINIEFYYRLRDELKFQSVEELISQIRLDKKIAGEKLGKD